VLAFGYTLLIVIVALTIPLAVNLRARARGELESQALLSAQTIAAGVGKEGLHRGPALDHQVAAYYAQIHDRVIVMDANGKVLADSQGNDSLGMSYADCGRPEILSALGLRCLDPQTGKLGTATPAAETTIRHSTDLGVDLLAAAAPVLNEGTVFGAVRITQDIGAVNAAVREVTIAIIAIGVAGLVAGMIVAFALADSLARPLTALAAAARRLGRGDFSARAGDVGGAREIRSLGDSFDEMADRVERTVRSQREFVANASHQLRTPLTGMKLRLEAAAADTNDPKVKKEILAADREVDRLADTVDRMLLIAKEVEEGHASFVDLRDVADRAAVRWRDRAGQAGTSVATAGLGARALADPVDLDQIVDNLIDNALAHGAGPIEIDTSLRDRSVILSVRDHGSGIPPEDRERVTERFYRGEAPRSAGSGLGLAIARELAERWGGDLAVSNDTGGGARVELRLPVAGPVIP
jgi:signal transduction histidine kinase